MKFIKNTKGVLKLQFPLLVTLLFSVLSLLGCCGMPGDFPPQLRSEQSTGLQKNVIQQTERKVIVLYHGLNAADSQRIKNLAEKLHADFQDATIVSFNRHTSATDPISKQAEVASQELMNYLLTNNLYGQNLFLIGDSQGGLLALELYKSYQELLNITGIITNHTPLQGAPIAASSKQDMQVLKNIVAGLEVTKVALSWLRPEIRSLQIPSFLRLCEEKASLSIEDLKPYSTFIEEIKKTLQTATIPILALGGNVPPVPCLMALAGGASNQQVAQTLPTQIALLNSLRRTGTIGTYIEKLESTITGLIGSEDSDCLVPLTSQIAGGIVTTQTFQSCVIEGYHHFSDIATSAQAYGEIVGFIKRY